MPRASRAGRRYQARVNFASGMGELWEWVIALREENRKQEVLFHLHLGIKIGGGLGHAGQAMAVAPGTQRNRRMPRASRVGRSYLVRLDFTDAMGELWDWVMGLPVGIRVQEILFHLHLGIKFARSLHAAGAAAIGGAHVPAVPTVAVAAAAPAVAVLPEAQPMPQGQSLVLDEDWDLGGFLGGEPN